MKNIITALLLVLSTACYAQFDNVKARYEADSTFTIHIDSSMRSYCEIEPVNYFGNLISRVYINQYCNYGYQPYEILHARDSTFYDDSVAVVHLPPVLGMTNSANADFTLIGSTGNIHQSIPIDNINSNYYTTLYLYRVKFLYWLVAERLNLTIK